ncbi:ABC transporter permease [Streptomyces millisiae]|uniref:ABC transporter permease subunit n=1 Tax=Streptomyces millisiae TaxID=3075542 RepID=A0ABU2LVH4_9ACTN|nr:ABC transporter permease [Streptomyces sp. DSM 44918]MDT0321595.1 ABC transporter permease subunit [Streptomyces sp. DSM 44918]
MRRLVAAEWLKLWTVRATGWTLGGTVAVATGFGALIGTSFRDHARSDAAPHFAGSYGLMLAQLCLVVFAVRAMGDEYTSGTIRASLLAAPRRGGFYAAKVVATALAVAVVAALSVAGSFLAAQATMGDAGVAPWSPGAPRALLGGWLYLMLMALLALGVTSVVRRSAAALGVLLPLLLLGSQGLANIPRVGTVLQFLPDQAAGLLLGMAGPPDDPTFARAYGPWTGMAITACWSAAALAAGCWTLHRRDA